MAEEGAVYLALLERKWRLLNGEDGPKRGQQRKPHRVHRTFETVQGDRLDANHPLESDGLRLGLTP